ncbi:MAG: hypothetical protein E7461_03915 [Ruminococcaceae bacterium]|nr:hypothetical protein [Oscillospiraceae bacterium]
MKLRLLALVLALLLLLSACVNTPALPTEPTNPTIATDPTEAPTDAPTEPEGPTDAPTEPPTEPAHQCPDEDPYQDVDKTAFYADYSPACCLTNAEYRSRHGLLSGILEVPGQYAEEAQYRPTEGDQFVCNTASRYADNGNTYIVVDGYGNEVLRIYKGGGYITLEEVAAYMYAFGGSSTGIPANHTTSKSTKPSSSIWGQYLRVNHSYFTGDTSRYPYEPELPDISGCGGTLRYYEMDIGTTGTTTPGYSPSPYNTGTKITRGAARIVYARQDKDGNGVFEAEKGEVHVFYTHNHYNDFREYLNYYGGWGEMFGNVTSGGAYNAGSNPTPYVPVVYKDLTAA